MFGEVRLRRSSICVRLRQSFDRSDRRHRETSTLEAVVLVAHEFGGRKMVLLLQFLVDGLTYKQCSILKHECNVYFAAFANG